MYTNSRIFRSVACLMSPGLKSASSATPGRQSSTSPVQSPQHLQISLRFLASYRTLIYLFIFWLFCKMTSMSTVLVILLWILVLSAMALCHLTSRREKSLIYSTEIKNVNPSGGSGRDGAGGYAHPSSPSPLKPTRTNPFSASGCTSALSQNTLTMLPWQLWSDVQKSLLFVIVMISWTLYFEWLIFIPIYCCNEPLNTCLNTL